MAGEEVPSADQDAWVAIAEAMREQLARRVPDLGAMKPEEIDSFVGAMQHAYWFHLAALTFDLRHQLEASRFTAD